MTFWEYRARRLELLHSAPPASKMSDHKFWALLGLMGAILGMAAVSILIDAVAKNGQTTDPTVLQAKLAILQMGMGGLIAGFGAACQAFFRHSATDETNAETMKSMADSLPAAPVLTSGGTTTTTTTVEPTSAATETEPQPVVVVNAPSAPVPVTGKKP